MSALRILVENCRPEFSFRCPKRWEELADTADIGVKHCSACDRRVYLCDTDQEAVDHARVGDCIARRERGPVMNITVGMMDCEPEPAWSDRLFLAVRRIFGRTPR